MKWFHFEAFPNVGSWADGTRITWRFSIQARSEREALDIVGRGERTGMDVRLVPPLPGVGLLSDAWFV